MWVESLRLLPALPREERIAFCNGLGIVFIGAAELGSVTGFYLAASLPVLTAALLFLTPMSFLVTTARNSRALVDAWRSCSAWRSVRSSPIWASGSI